MSSRPKALKTATEAPRPPHPVRQHFDVFIESSVVGLRKPDPRIYELA